MKIAKSLDIGHRGMILIAFPLMCHLIFVIILGYRLNEIHSYMVAETKSQNIIRQGHLVDNAMLNQCLEDYLSINKGSVSHEEQEEQFRSMTHRVNEFVKLIYNDPKHQEGLKRYQNAIKNITVSLATFGRLQRSPNWRNTNRELQSTLLQQAPEMYRALSAILAVERAKFTADAAAIDNSISSLLTGVCIFAILNMVVAAILGLYFAMMISAPLSHIRKNGIRLSNRQPLLPVLDNTAEFSKLDSLLHTASKSLDDALLHNKELIENTADTIVSLNEKGELLSINTFGTELLGYVAVEIIGKPIHELVALEQSFEAEKHLRNTISSDKPEVFELQLRTKFGDYIDTRWSCYWSDQHKKLFAVIHDISEQKRIEQLKEDFADMISHDLRSPLMAMHNSFSLILTGAKGGITEQTAADLKRGVANLDHLMQLVNDLLDFQKLKAGRMELEKSTFNIKEAVTQSVELLTGFSNDRKMEIRTPSGDLNIYGDCPRIVQVLTNLVSNAIKFSPEGEVIDIDYKEVPGGVELSVTDRGCGIADENKERIFEIFEQATTADEKQGTGLGLAICKLLVEAHHGRVWVEQHELGRGSKFIVFLPSVG